MIEMATPLSRPTSQPSRLDFLRQTGPRLAAYVAELEKHAPHLLFHDAVVNLFCEFSIRGLEVFRQPLSEPLKDIDDFWISETWIYVFNHGLPSDDQRPKPLNYWLAKAWRKVSRQRLTWQYSELRLTSQDQRLFARIVAEALADLLA